MKKTLKETADKSEEIYRKAFDDTRKDLEETNEYNTEQRAEELANKKLLAMLSIVDMNSIVTLDAKNGFLYIGGEKTDDAKLANLRSEAEFLMESDIWKLLQETPKELAHKALFITSESLDDLKKGKSMLYTLSAQQNIINILLSYKKK